jgi:hypothetical protein
MPPRGPKLPLFATLFGASPGGASFSGQALLAPFLALTAVLATPVITLAGFPGGVGTPPLSDYRWDYRPLVLFAPAEADPDYRAMLSGLEANRDGLDDREMVVLGVVGSRVDVLAAPPGAPAPPSATALRRYYEAPAGDFGLRLVGKDGGVKLDRARDVGWADIFSQIDSMPMRQREMRGG